MHGSTPLKRAYYKCRSNLNIVLDEAMNGSPSSYRTSESNQYWATFLAALRFEARQCIGGHGIRWPSQKQEALLWTERDRPRRFQDCFHARCVSSTCLTWTLCARVRSLGRQGGQGTLRTDGAFLVLIMIGPALLV